MTHWPVHPVDVFQLQHAEDNSLASGDHLQTKLYDPQWKLNRTAWFANNMLQHAEDDSLASGDHLQIKLYDPQWKLNRTA